MSRPIVELDFAETRRQIELLFAANVAVVLKSKPGQGKTSMIQQYADDQGPDYGLFEINGSLSNQPDYAGWFYKNTEHYTDADGNEVTIEAGRYSYPYFLFDKRSGRPAFQFRRGVIVFEEYGQTDLDLKRALGQTFLEKRVGQHPLPQDFNIIGLSNYEGGRDAVTRDFDFLINRRAELHMALDIDSWLVWAVGKGLMNMTMAFASMPAHEVFAGNVPKDQGPWLTPRSLELLDRYMQEVVRRKIPLDDPGVIVTAGGLVGSGSAQQYTAFAGLRDKIPTVSQIIADPTGTPVPKEMDKQMFIVFNMADAADKKNIDQLVTYMGRLQTDLGVSFYRNALTRDKSLMSCKAFGDWAVANKQLLAIVSSRF
jgi:hypothetical protein